MLPVVESHLDSKSTFTTLIVSYTSFPPFVINMYSGCLISGYPLIRNFVQLAGMSKSKALRQYFGRPARSDTVVQSELTVVQSELIVEQAELILVVFEFTVVDSDFGAKSRILFRSDQ